MKVLAIRGKDLASLAGAFEVRLDEAPLRDAGVFAIVGPTGAGKSTLLDALCLALYDRTPRLDGNSRVQVGRAADDDATRVGDRDTRALLRRGAAEGHAEVDFVGAQGQRCRATWSVRRARGKADGRLVPVEVRLVDLDTGRSLCGGTKTETLAALERLVGLSFEQFRRSVLLPQGDFASFLRANAGERADLLERMTGTGVYADLSRAAFARDAAERARLQQLEARIGEAVPLGDAERAALGAEVDVLQARAPTVAEGLAAARRALAWHERRKALAGRAQAAADAAARAEASWTSIGGGAGLAAPAARDAAEEAVRALEALDRRVAEAQSAARLADREAARLHALAESAATGAVAADAALLEADRRIADGEASVAREAALVALLPTWPALRSTVEAYGRTRDEAARAAREVARLEAEVADLDRRREAAAATVAAARATEGRARAAAETATAAASAPELAGAAEAAAREGGRAIAAAEALASARAASQARADGASARAEGAAASQEAVVAAAAAEAARATAVSTSARLDEARRALEATRAALGLAARRAELVEGEPCPLCGAIAHPWAHGGAPADVALKALADRVAALEIARRAALEAGATGDAKASGARDRAEAAGARATTAASREAEAVARVRRALDGLRDVTSLDGGAAVEAVERLAYEVQRAADGARARAAAAERARATADERTRAHTAALVALHAAEQAVAALDGPRTERREALRAATDVRGRATGEAAHALDAAATGLAPLGIERPALEGGPLRVVASVEARIEAHRATAAALERDRGGRAGLASAAATTRDVAADRRRDADAARVAAQEARTRAEAAAAERVARFAGRPTDDVRRTLRAAVEAARSHAERAADLAAHAADAPPDLDEGAARARAAAGEAELAAVQRRIGAAQSRLATDDATRARVARLQEELVAARAQARVWADLSALVGSADGKKLRVFAQSLTLDALLLHANETLAELRPRYRLERVPGTDMDLQVLDHDLGDEVRAVTSLSGGETFLVSLALALGLSSLSARDVRVESLFVDEGFGSLDSESLEVALGVLDSLQARGCQVGVISHVGGLAERLASRVEVTPMGAGRSRVAVVGS
ncbi:MAG: AAA family ATPase [Planctomycetes bacterium]|nr:AAA family ATPase [Planctomycetota bacterium]